MALIQESLHHTTNFDDTKKSGLKLSIHKEDNEKEDNEEDNNSEIFTPINLPEVISEDANSEMVQSLENDTTPRIDDILKLRQEMILSQLKSVIDSTSMYDQVTQIIESNFVVLKQELMNS